MKIRTDFLGWIRNRIETNTNTDPKHCGKDNRNNVKDYVKLY